jgi:UDPglucose 6-dehydrogenase
VKVAVVGSGYVGLVVGAGLAECGNEVICVDIDQGKVERLNRGEIPIYEPGLEPLVRGNLDSGRLSFSTDLEEAVRQSRILFIAVGTPPGEDGSADLGHVLQVARGIGRAMDGERIVLTKSTVPVGTAARVRAAIEAETDHPVHVCSNPEFLKEGAAVEDFMKPDRIVLGVDDAHAARELEALFEPFVRQGNRLLIMDVASAEVTKYAANAMLATRISFMNLMAGLCERAGADVAQVRMGVGSDPRIGSAFLYPGIGYGGSCFPKDVRALVRTLEDFGLDATLLDAVESVNAQAKNFILKCLDEEFGEDLRGRHFAVWGLAFKPNTDDMREAPSLTTLEGILARGGTVVAHDPVAMDEARARAMGDRIAYAPSPYHALDGADALLIHTEWLPYRNLNFERVRSQLRGRLVIDGRNLYDPQKMAAEGLKYRSVGRPVRPVIAAGASG